MSKFAKGINSKNANGDNKNKSPGNLIITLYRLSKYEAPSCNGNGFWGIKFSMIQFEKGDKIKIINKLPLGNLLIIILKLSKFEAPNCNSFLDIKFLCPNLQRTITQKNKMFFF